MWSRLRKPVSSPPGGFPLRVRSLLRGNPFGQPGGFTSREGPPRFGRTPPPVDELLPPGGNTPPSGDSPFSRKLPPQETLSSGNSSSKRRSHARERNLFSPKGSASRRGGLGGQQLLEAALRPKRP